MKNKRLLGLFVIVIILCFDFLLGLLLGVVGRHEGVSFWQDVFGYCDMSLGLFFAPFLIYGVITLLFPKFDDYLEAKYVNIDSGPIVIVWYYFGTLIGGALIQKIIKPAGDWHLIIAFILVHVFIKAFNKERM